MSDSLHSLIQLDSSETLSPLLLFQLWVSLSNRCQRCGGFVVTQPWPQRSWRRYRSARMWLQALGLETKLLSGAFAGPLPSAGQAECGPSHHPQDAHSEAGYGLLGASRQDDCLPRPQKRHRATGGKASVCFCLFSLLFKAAYLSVDRAWLVFSSLRRQDQGGNRQSEGTKPSLNLVAPEHSGAPLRL